MSESQNKWWGYLHTNGTVQVKRFFDYQDLAEARASDFVVLVVGPFDAADRNEAITKAESVLL